MSERRLWKAKEVARRLGVSVWRLYLEARAGRVPGVVRIGTRSLRFDSERIEQFIREGGATTSPVT